MTDVLARDAPTAIDPQTGARLTRGWYLRSLQATATLCGRDPLGLLLIVAVFWSAAAHANDFAASLALGALLYPVAAIWAARVASREAASWSVLIRRAATAWGHWCLTAISLGYALSDVLGDKANPPPQTQGFGIALLVQMQVGFATFWITLVIMAAAAGGARFAVVASGFGHKVAVAPVPACVSILNKCSIDEQISDKRYPPQARTRSPI